MFINSRSIKMCNCAGCGKELLGESMRSPVANGFIPQKYMREIMTGRVNSRPYCSTCFPLAKARKAEDGKPRSVFSF